MVTLLHPGFNRTDMTAKYSAIWDVEGAVEPSGEPSICSLLHARGNGIAFTTQSLRPSEGTSRLTHCTKLYTPLCPVPTVGAMRVLYEVKRSIDGGIARSGKFINCEDGLEIPW